MLTFLTLLNTTYTILELLDMPLDLVRLPRNIHILRPTQHASLSRGLDVQARREGPVASAREDDGADRGVDREGVEDELHL